MPKCECRQQDCKEETAGGLFAPGHDQKLRAAIERQVGGLLALRDLIDAVDAYARGATDIDDLGRVVRKMYAALRG